MVAGGWLLTALTQRMQRSQRNAKRIGVVGADHWAARLVCDFLRCEKVFAKEVD